ncbi:MAG: aldose 1-epimerase family protein, partial [Oscillospiraceae bacterium]
MRYILENDMLRVEVDSFGAELKSVKSKKNDREYMWYADKKFWARTSPVLFPFVGSVKNKEYILDGKRYPMGQHGFARDMEHSFLSKTDDEIYFELKSNEETLSKYPFEFVLKI